MVDNRAAGVPESLRETVTALRSGALPLATYVDAACDRVEAREGEIHALVPEAGRRARLRAEAAGLADAYPDDATRPPLYGALVGVKDIIHTHGFVTRAGSDVPPELFAGAEATVVTRLRAAGALVLGKTRTAEFATSTPPATRNPRNPTHTPGGSSSGSAAAVAAGYCALALGTQTVGSVIRPAAFCGIVGFKPTYGRIPIAGVVPYSVSVDTVGLFAPTVADIRLVAPVVIDDWTPTIVAERKPVLGVPEGEYLLQATAEGLTAFARQLAQLEAAGYEVRPIPALRDIAAINQAQMWMNAGELARVHAPWFAQYEDRYRPGTAAIIRMGQDVSDAEIAAGRASRSDVRAELEALMGEYGVDLWVCPPATGPAPEGIASTGDPIMNLPWSHAGMPALSVPAGEYRQSGLPLGLQLVAHAAADESLLAWAEEIAGTVASVTLA